MVTIFRTRLCPEAVSGYSEIATRMRACWASRYRFRGIRTFTAPDGVGVAPDFIIPAG